MIEDSGEAETLSDSEEEIKKKKALYKKKRDAQTLSLAVTHLSLSAFAISMPRSAPLFASASASASAVSVPGSLALLSSAFPSTSGVSVPVLELSALPSMLSISGVSVPVPRLSAPLSVFGLPVFKPGSSLLPFSTWSDLQKLMPVLGR